MTLVINIDKLKTAIEPLIDGEVDSINVPFYDVFVFDDVEIFDENGYRRVKNNIEDFAGTYVDNYRLASGSLVSPSSRFVVPANYFYSDRRHLLNHMIHVIVGRVPGAGIVGLQNNFREQLSSFFNIFLPSSTNKTIYPSRVHGSNVVSPRGLTYVDFIVSEEALNNFSSEYIAYNLAAEYLQRLDINLFRALSVYSTAYVGVTPWPVPVVSNPTVKDLVDLFAIYHLYHRTREQDYVVALFMNFTDFLRYLSLKSSTNQHLLCNNCRLDEMYEYERVKVMSVPLGAPLSDNVMFFNKGHVFWGHTGDLILTRRREASTNTVEIMMEGMWQIEASYISDNNFGSFFPNHVAISSVNINATVPVL